MRQKLTLGNVVIKQLVVLKVFHLQSKKDTNLEILDSTCPLLKLTEGFKI